MAFEEDDENDDSNEPFEIKTLQSISLKKAHSTPEEILRTEISDDKDYYG